MIIRISGSQNPLNVAISGSLSNGVTTTAWASQPITLVVSTSAPPVNVSVSKLATHASTANSASFAVTASYALASAGVIVNAISASYALLAVSAISSSWASSSISSSYAEVANSINFIPATSSYALIASSALNVNNSPSSSWASHSVTADTAISASFAVTSAFALNVTTPVSVSWASQSISSSYATTDWGAINNKPIGIVSSSIQINTGSFSGSFIGDGTNIINVVSASYATTSSAATSITFIPPSSSYAGTDWNAINNKPISLISSSVQLSGSSFEGRFTGSYTGSFRGDGSNIINVVSASYSVTSSAATSITFIPPSSSYAGTDWNAVNNKPIGIVTSSIQLSGSSFEGKFTGSYTGSFKGDGTNVINVVSSSYAGTDWNAINNKPVGIVTSSIQLSGSSFEGRFTGSYTGSFKGDGIDIINVISSSFSNTASAATSITFVPASSSYAGTDWNVINNKPIGLVTSSIQLSGSSFEGKFTGSYTGSFKGDGANVINVISSSYAVTSSAATSITFIPPSASYAGTDWNVINNRPIGIISSSIQLSGSSFEGKFTGSYTGSFKGDGTNIINVISSSYAGTDWNAINNKPIGLVTSSIQLSGSSFEGIFTGSYTGSFKGDGSNIINVVSSSYALSSSAATSITFIPPTSSYAGTDWNAINNRPVGIVTSSIQLSGSSFEGRFTGSYTGSMYGILIGNADTATSSSYSLTASYALTNAGTVTSAATASYVDWPNIDHKPVGLVTSSIQLSGSSFEGRFTGSYTGSFKGDGSNIINVISASYAGTDWNAINNRPIGIVTSSIQLSGSIFQGLFTGSHTGSFKGDGTDIINIISSSYAVTSSAATSITFIPPTSSYAGTDWNAINNKPIGIISSSGQLSGSIFQGLFTGSYTGSFKGDGSNIINVVSASYAGTDWNAINNRPVGIVTSSIQLSGSSFEGRFTGSYTGSFKGIATSSNIYVFPSTTAFGNEGTMFYDSTRSSLAVMDVNGTPIYLDEDQIVPIQNNSGVSLTKGSVIELAGSPGGSGQLRGKLAIARSIPPNEDIFILGVAHETIIHGGTGHVLIMGEITGLDTSMFSDGDALYLSNTVSGSLTASLPANVEHRHVGHVINAHATQGRIYVTIHDDLRKDWNTQILNIPSGLVSSSIQINTGSFTGSFKGDGSGIINVISSSYAVTSSAATSITFIPPSASYAGTDWNAINNRPIGIVTSSAQLSGSSFEGKFTGSYTGSFKGDGSNIINVISASYAGTDWNVINNKPVGIVTSSIQLSGSSFEGRFTGSYTGSFKGDGTDIINIISSSYATTSSYATIAQNVLGSITSASYAGTDWNAINNRPIGIVTSSAQLSGSSFEGRFTGSYTGSFKGDGSNIINVVSSSYANTDWNAINNKPIGIVTSSIQLSGSSFEGKFTGSYTGSFKGDGTNIINVVSSSYALSASAATSITFVPISASYAGTDWNAINNKPIGLITSSVQLSGSSFEGKFTGSYTGSFKGDGSNIINVTSASYAGTDWGAINNKPVGLVTSSVQLSGSSFEGRFTGSYTGSFKGDGTNIINIVSASYAGTDWNAINNKPIGLVTSSIQLSGSSFEGRFTGSYTGSFKGDGTNVINVVSSSYAVTSSAATSITFIPVSSSYAGTDWNAINNRPVGIVTSSTQLSGSSFEGKFTGSYTGSFKGDGTNIINVVSASYATTSSYSTIAQNVLGSITSASYALTASYATIAQNVLGSITSASYAATASYLEGTLDGDISGTFSGSGAQIFNLNASKITAGTIGNAYLPSQINIVGYTGSFTGSYTGSLLGSASYASTDWGAVNNKPIGIVTSSIQLSGSSFEGRFTGSYTGSFKGDGSNIINVVSSSYAGTDWNAINNKPIGIVTSSTQLSGSSFEGKFTGSYTGSFKGDGTNIINVVSASYAVTSSYASVAQNVLGSITSASFATTAAGLMAGTQKITGSLLVSGNIDATGYSVTASAFKGDGSQVTGVISASYALSASWAPGGGPSTSASYAVTSSYADTVNIIRAGFYETGSTVISGSPLVTSSSYSLVAKELETRKTYIYITPDSVGSASYYTTSINLTSEFILYAVSASDDCRLRIYNTPSNRLTDISRSVTEYPSASAGVLADIVFTQSIKLLGMAPAPIIYGGITASDANIPITITNLLGSSRQFSMSFTYQTL